MSLPTLDPDLLRAFVLIAEGASFTRAAELVGRTQSAVSMQVKRLEEALGQPVLSRSRGGATELTAHGHFLLSRARQVLALNDEIVAAFREPAVAGVVRLGTPDDYALSFLPPVLKRFAETHPAVEVEVMCAPSSELVPRMRAGVLDLTLISNGHELRGWETVPLWRGPLQWITSTRHAPHRRSPLPLALARDNCVWRAAALAALERAGVRYRIAYTSATQVGTHAPVLAGLAVTVSALSWLPDSLRPLRPEEAPCPLPDFGIRLLRGRHRDEPVADALAEHIVSCFEADRRRMGSDKPDAVAA
ncbi:MAG TPA: LysR substrate-binding domain-containing protein [Acidisphaera sp.]|nr:LysR substrate-binding domain-containing protein [Acidisphaera sp.]